MSYGIVEGYVFDDDVSYCPFCGAEVREFYGDGTAQCRGCGIRFAVIEVDDED